MPIPDGEDLFHFFYKPDDYDRLPGGEVRLRSNKFSTTTHTLSFNQGSIWPLEKNREVARAAWGICSLTAGELRGVYVAEHSDRGAIDILHDPWEAEPDPLLGIPNPSHASVNRTLTRGESKRAARIASNNIHRSPGEVT